VALPLTAEFKDYAAIKFRGSRVAIVSQASRRLWIGNIDKAGHKFIGDGTTYKFPSKSYGNVEGVAWLSDDLLVVVLDRRKAKKQPIRYADKDRSIHVFRLPAAREIRVAPLNVSILSWAGASNIAVQFTGSCRLAIMVRQMPPSRQRL
jgi:hypothetical protein